MRLDHVVIAVRHLETAVRDFGALGFTITPGGVHANAATHNALICLHDGTYIELLAPTGMSARPAAVDFSPMLAQGEGLAGCALLCEDIEAAARSLRAGGAAVGPIIDGGRVRPDGLLLAWKLALVDGGFAPFLIQDVTPRSLRVPGGDEAVRHPNGALGIASVPERRDGVWSPLQLLVSVPAPAFDPALTHGVSFILEYQREW